MESALEWLNDGNDDFEYTDIDGVDVPTHKSISEVMEKYAINKFKEGFLDGLIDCSNNGSPSCFSDEGVLKIAEERYNSKFN